jgi:molybdenum cofactor synthesis domain-containing protein
MFTVGILTISDKGSRGERHDRSGELMREMLASPDCRVVKYDIVPDEKGLIAAKLTEWADGGGVDVILTTGGTGLAQRDVTPEATYSVIEKGVPGLSEAMRMKTMEKAPTAVLSRAVAGVRGKCLIINMPGSPKAVEECLGVVLPVIPHAVAMLKREVTEHVIPDGLRGQAHAH